MFGCKWLKGIQMLMCIWITTKSHFWGNLNSLLKQVDIHAPMTWESDIFFKVIIV